MSTIFELVSIAFSSVIDVIGTALNMGMDMLSVIFNALF